MGNLLPWRQGIRPIKNDAQHPFHIVAHIRIGKAQHQIALMGKIEIAVPVLDRIVPIIIDFDDQPIDGQRKSQI
ncbi:hypothetical protein BF95_15270 [Sphingobium sp. Ant17]|nr:hypothetical protein BF95_15270 [Sphingobium sp. Ant17]